jgi:hypothetical protein
MLVTIADDNDASSSSPPKRQDSFFDPSLDNTPQLPHPVATRHQSIGSGPLPSSMTGVMKTRSYGMGTPVFDRSGVVLSDEDIIIVTVKLTNKFRKNSVTGAEDLPGR